MADPTLLRASGQGFTVEWLEAHRLPSPRVDADAIVGLRHVHEALDALVLAMGDPTQADELGLTSPVAILLYGPPGTGKSLTAGHLIGSLATVPGYELPPEELTPERLRGTLAHLATSGDRALVLLEEVEAWGLSRGDFRHSPESRAILYAALGALDRLVPGQGPFVIATSNAEPGELDAGLVRSGRLGLRIRFSLPAEAEREALYRHFLERHHAAPLGDEVITHLARSSRGLTPADIEAVVADAAAISVTRAIRDGLSIEATHDFVRLRQRSLLDMDDLVSAIGRRADLLPDEEWPDLPTRWRVAAHEAGHAVVAASLRGAGWVYSIRTGPRGGETIYGADGGRLERLPDDELRDAIVAIGAGSIAERLLLGEASLLGEVDTMLATGLAVRRLEAGLDPTVTPVSLDSLGSRAPEVLQAERAVAITTLLGTARVVATRLLETQLDALSSIAHLIDQEPDLTGAFLAEQIVEAGVRVGGEIVDEWRRRTPSTPSSPPATG